LLNKQYELEICPVYFDDSDYSSAKFKLGDIDFCLSCHYETGIIFLSSNQKNDENSFSDDLAVYVVYNLIELLSKEKKRNC
jgi:hypothetical protein